MNNLIKGRTTIAIAHRLSTLRRADRLVVMDRGRIVEIGNHDDLMAREGHYWRLYMAQSKQLDEPPPLGEDEKADAVVGSLEKHPAEAKV